MGWRVGNGVGGGLCRGTLKRTGVFYMFRDLKRYAYKCVADVCSCIEVKVQNT